MNRNPSNTNPPGIVSRSHNVAASPEVHERLASLAPRERGEAIARLRLSPRESEMSAGTEDGSRRLHVRLAPWTKVRLLALAEETGAAVGGVIEMLLRMREEVIAELESTEPFADLPEPGPLTYEGLRAAARGFGTLTDDQQAE